MDQDREVYQQAILFFLHFFPSFFMTCCAILSTPIEDRDAILGNDLSHKFEVPLLRFSGVYLNGKANATRFVHNPRFLLI